MNNYQIERKLNKTGKRAVFYPTINGKRINRTNYARKYDAKSLLRHVVARYGDERLAELTQLESAA